MIPIFCGVDATFLCSVYIKTSSNEFCQSIDSILSGTVLPSQILVVIDGPVSFELFDLIEGYNSFCDVFSFVRLSVNVGLGAALREGLHYCKSEIVLRFDTDDVNLGSRLEKTIEFFLCNPSVDILNSSVACVDSSFVFADECSYASIRSFPNSDKWMKFILSFMNPINHPSVAFKKSSIEGIGSYDGLYPFFEDYSLWLRCRKKGLTFGSIEDVLVCMRTNSQLSRRSGFSYFKFELSFFTDMLLKGFLPFYSIPVFAVRCVLRLFPFLLSIFRRG